MDPVRVVMACFMFVVAGMSLWEAWAQKSAKDWSVGIAFCLLAVYFLYRARKKA